MLDGYTLDLGFHALSCAGDGYFALFEELVGGFGDHPITVKPFLAGTWFDGMFMHGAPPVLNRHGSQAPAEYQRIGKGFSTSSAISLASLRKFWKNWIRYPCTNAWSKTGFDQSEMVYAVMKCNATLATTINNPNDISIGDILRYFSPGAPSHDRDEGQGGFLRRVQRERVGSLGGMRLPAASRSSVERLRLSTRLKSIEIEDGRVTGVMVDSGGKEERSRRLSSSYNIPIQELFDYAAESAFPADFVSRVKKLYGYGSITPYFGLNDLVVPGTMPNGW